MKKRFIKKSIAILVFIMVVGCLKDTNTLTFSADMVHSLNNRTMEGKIFVKGNEYRMDIVENGEELSILVDRASGKQKVVVHSQKLVQEYLNTSEKSLNNNPFENFKYQLEISSADTIGSEIINGYECTKIEVYDDNKKMLSAWIADTLNWPIKVKTAGTPSKDVTLNNIKEGVVVKGNLFKMPEGYTFQPLKEETEEVPEERPDIRKMKEEILVRIKKRGIELETEEGKLAIREFGGTVLSRYFPRWSFFRVIRRMEKTDSIPLGFKLILPAVVSRDIETIYLLNSPESDSPIDIGLKIFNKDKIKLNNEEEVKSFGKALALLYFVKVGVREVSLLNPDVWKVSLGTRYKEEGSFIITLDRSGALKGIEYKLKEN